jgi:hypothetical protein
MQEGDAYLKCKCLKIGLPCKKISVSAASHQISVKTELNIEDWKLWTLDFNCCWLVIHHNIVLPLLPTEVHIFA